METIATYSKLIKDASRILKHQKEISILKGENFNVFSILKMETKENATHSAFLGELLSPEGSHDMGTVFLKLFLETLDLDHIDLDSARVKLEHYIGERDDSAKTGGRMDIFIYDKYYNTICIENKIDAPDQDVQIQRYCNYNTLKNKVFYLTKEGEEPGDSSKGNLNSGEHFHNLSYSVDIIQWLTSCMKEASTYPILRESINQYIILIKKLTNQLTDSKMANEIQNLIIKNYKATKTLESNARVVELEYTQNFLKEIKLELEKELKDGWVIEAYHELDEPYTGLYINHIDWPKKVYVKLEGQSKVPWNDSIYGVIGSKDICDREILNKELSSVDILKQGFKNNKVWPFYKTLLHFGNDESRSVLFDEAKRKELVLEVSRKLSELSKVCEKPLKKVHLANPINTTVLN